MMSSDSCYVFRLLGTPSIKTFTDSFATGIVVQTTKTENSNVQIGSAIAIDYPFQNINRAAITTPID